MPAARGVRLFIQDYRGKVATMRFSPLVPLVFAMLSFALGNKPVKAVAPGKQAVAEVKKHMASDQLALGGPVVNSVGMVLVPIPIGEFQMGSPASDTLARPGEKPQKLVKIAKAFYLSAFEVTQQQFEKVMGTGPWQDKRYVQEGPDYPATYVSWNDAVEFCRKLSEKEGLEYRLPTEAEWEYACRAGTTTAYSFGDDASELGEYAWYKENAVDVGQVGQKEPNPWGLYDMHGNVWKWCSDWGGDYPSGSTTDPTGAASGSSRVCRGGSWYLVAGICRSAFRYGDLPSLRNYYLGFRVALSPSGQ